MLGVQREKGVGSWRSLGIGHVHIFAGMEGGWSPVDLSELKKVGVVGIQGIS